jgi:hypothetical protein
MEEVRGSNPLGPTIRISEKISAVLISVKNLRKISVGG